MESTYQGERNERGERLIEWAKMPDVIIGNTFFEQPNRWKYTWTRPDVKSKIKVKLRVRKSSIAAAVTCLNLDLLKTETEVQENFEIAILVTHAINAHEQ